MRRQSKSTESTISNAEAKWNMESPSFETVTQAYRAWFSHANRTRDETMRFAHERFTKELDAVVHLARCSSPDEALAVLAAFANNMAEDYIAEGQTIVDLVSEMAKELSSSPKPGRAHQ